MRTDDCGLDITYKNQNKWEIKMVTDKYQSSSLQYRAEKTIIDAMMTVKR